jgi:hypothetical protein
VGGEGGIRAERDGSRAKPEDDPKRNHRARAREWRRGWNSHHCCLLKTKNLADFRFVTIRQIRTKTLVETRIEHAELRHALQEASTVVIF